MSYECRVYPDQSLGVVWLSGRISAPEWIGGLDALYGSSDWKSGFATLWDLRGISELVLLPGDMDAIMERVAALKKIRGTGKIAFLVSRDLEETIAMLYILRQRRSRRPGQVFWSVDEVFEWLRISNPPAEVLHRVAQGT